MDEKTKEILEWFHAEPRTLTKEELRSNYRLLSEMIVDEVIEEEAQNMVDGYFTLEITRTHMKGAKERDIEYCKREVYKFFSRYMEQQQKKEVFPTLEAHEIFLPKGLEQLVSYLVAATGKKSKILFLRPKRANGVVNADFVCITHVIIEIDNLLSPHTSYKVEEDIKEIRYSIFSHIVERFADVMYNDLLEKSLPTSIPALESIADKIRHLNSFYLEEFVKLVSTAKEHKWKNETLSEYFYDSM